MSLGSLPRLSRYLGSSTRFTASELGDTVAWQRRQSAGFAALDCGARAALGKAFLVLSHKRQMSAMFLLDHSCRYGFIAFF